MKILIIGLSGSGKSTVAPMIAKKYNLDVMEADDAVTEANGGTWPHFNDELMDKVFEETNKKVIKMDNVLYITAWLTEQRIKDFYNQGFKIIEMHADFEALIKRKNSRDGESVKATERFKNTYISYFETVLSDELKEMYLVSIDTTKLASDKIFLEIDTALYTQYDG